MRWLGSSRRGGPDREEAEGRRWSLSGFADSEPGTAEPHRSGRLGLRAERRVERVPAFDVELALERPEGGTAS
jgi:hypothetical protein